VTAAAAAEEGLPVWLEVDTAEAWRAWLEAHAATQVEAWLVSYRRTVRRRCVSDSAATDIALCFGWVRAGSTNVDNDTFLTRWRPRPTTRVWSTSDIIRARRLIASGLMTEHGFEALPRGLRTEAIKSVWLPI
jgi:uncharacterized protein YdeI (YjbR/CyaY-like superfamily)